MSDEISIGGWCHLDSPYVAELIAASGYDWCCVDMQHGMTGRQTLMSMVQAVAAGGCECLVRAAGNRHDLVGHALDAGVSGVLVPQVSSLEQAAQAVRSCQYPPAGNRSWGPLRPKLRVSAATPTQLNEGVRCYLMIEDPEGLAAAADMAALPGVTGLFVGPSDLALALYGDPTLANAPKTINAARAAVDACQASGAVAGVYSGPSEHAVEAWRAAGFTMLAVDSDSNMLLTAARTQAATANRMLR